MTDMEAKARELWVGLGLSMNNPDDFSSIELIRKALTEAHNAGMEEAARVAEGAWNCGIAHAHGGQCELPDKIAAAIREKINPAEREDAIKKFPNGNKYNISNIVKDLHDGEA